MKVSLFIPCFVDTLYPEVAWDTFNLLQKAGYTVNYPQEQTCCGHPSWDCGRKELTKPIAEKWINDFIGNEEYIVAPSYSCVMMVKNYYDEYFANSSYHLKMKNTQNKLWEIGSFITEVIKPVSIKAKSKIKVAYLESCFGGKCGFSSNHIIQLLNNIHGCEVVNYAMQGVCCGLGGQFAGSFPEVSYSLSKQFKESIKESEIDFLIGSDMNCINHLNTLKDTENIPTLSIASFLNNHVDITFNTSEHGNTMG